MWGISALVIALIVTVLMWRNGRESRLHEEDALEMIGIILVVLGIVFAEDPLIGYSYIGVGVALSIASLVIRRR